MDIMNVLFRMSVLASVFLLVNCVPTSPLKDTAGATPKATRNGIKMSPNAQDFSQMLWWEKMHDARLNQLIEEGLTHNNQINSAQARILQAQAQLKAAYFTWLPTLSATATAFTAKGWNTQYTPEGALARNAALSNLGNLDIHGNYTGFVPSYSLNIFANANNTKWAQASLHMQKAQYQAVRLSIISQISGSYFMLLGQKDQLKVQNQLIQHLKNLRQLENTRYRDGMSGISVVANIDQEIANNKAQLISIENSIAHIENTIQLLINHNPGPIKTGKQLSQLSVDKLIPAHLPAIVLANRPDIIIAIENIKMSQANIGLAYSELFPTISLTGLLGRSSVELVNLIQLSTGLGIAQAAVSIPLLNLAAYQKIKAAKAGAKASYFDYLQTLRAAFVEVDNSLTKQQKMNAILINQGIALNAAKKSYNIALTQYTSGAQDSRNAINAQINLDHAQLNWITAKTEQLNTIVEVYQALAGGYKEENKNDIL